MNKQICNADADLIDVLSANLSIADGKPSAILVIPGQGMWALDNARPVIPARTRTTRGRVDIGPWSRVTRTREIGTAPAAGELSALAGYGSYGERPHLYDCYVIAMVALTGDNGGITGEQVVVQRPATHTDVRRTRTREYVREGL